MNAQPDAREQESTDRVQILDAAGNVREGATVPPLSTTELLAMYEALVLARRFDERAISLQRQGRLATYAPMTGQEGSQVATSYALDAEDWLFPTYRDHAAKHVHGRPLASLLAPLAGYRQGYALEEDVNVMPEYIPIATQIPQAMGMAWGFKLQEESRAVLCHFGDGATSEGDFHEGLNFAGVFDVPAVFVCNNNQWAISTPVERQTATETLAEKAAAYGIDSVRVDGLDPLAVYQVTRAAIHKAKHPGPGQGRPTLIESLQYRFGAHTTADDPSVYRADDAAEYYRERDPVDRLRSYLLNEGVLTPDREQAIDSRVDEQIQQAVEEVESMSADPDDIFEHVSAELSPRLESQREELRALRERYGDEAFAEVL